MKATEVTAGLAESNGSLLPGLWRDSLHVTCGLTACTPGSAPGPTLGNEYGKTLPFYLTCDSACHTSGVPVIFRCRFFPLPNVPLAVSSVEHSVVANFIRNIYVRLCKHVTRSGLLNNVLYYVAKVFCYLFSSSV